MMQPHVAVLAVLAAAANASPFPQGVTSALAPSSAAPPGCTPNYSGSFGLAVNNITSSSSPRVRRQISQIKDGQIQPGPFTPAPTPTMAPISQIKDGQPQAPTAQAISQIKDGQPQAPTYTSPKATPTAQAISQIKDGQPQAPTYTSPKATPTAQAISQIKDGQPQAPTYTSPKATPTAQAISQITDGQPQAPTYTSPKSTPTAQAISQITDGQPQAPTRTLPRTTPKLTSYVTSTALSTVVSAKAATQISDNQVQAPTGGSMVTSVKTSVTIYPATSASPSAAAASPSSSSSSVGSPGPVACASNSTLTLTLSNGVLKDSQGRIGYIAANYQFQFDSPPQAGSIYTSGWTVCSNGNLALGGSTTFYQCLSGNFYNLYDRSFGAGQCTPVTLSAVGLQSC